NHEHAEENPLSDEKLIKQEEFAVIPLDGQRKFGVLGGVSLVPARLIGGHGSSRSFPHVNRLTHYISIT
ncbi:MAG: hypothetical protein ACRD3H_18335, partial [Terriglobales bacterium]